MVSILLPDLRGGGAERVTVNLANEICARGFAVDMLLMRDSGELMPLLSQKIQIVDLGAGRMRDVVLPLTRYLRLTQPTALLACMWPLTVLAVAARAASRAKTRLVVAEHTTWSASGRSRDWIHRSTLAASMRICFPRADSVVTVSLGAAADLARIAGLPRDRIVAIYNPIVGAERIAGMSATCELARESLDWATGPHHKVLAVGSLKAIKDYPTLLRAFAILRRRVNAKLLVLGEGDERGSLERLIVDLGIEADVILPGFVANTEDYYRRADLHVLSSVGEGLPTVIVEALEHGVPVVSTDCPSGPREILDQGRYGELVQVAQPDALADAMQRALSSAHDRGALRARAAHFSVTRAADAYLDLLLPDWRSVKSSVEGRS